MTITRISETFSTQSLWVPVQSSGQGHSSNSWEATTIDDIHLWESIFQRQDCFQEKTLFINECSSRKHSIYTMRTHPLITVLECTYTRSSVRQSATRPHPSTCEHAQGHTHLYTHTMLTGVSPLNDSLSVLRQSFIVTLCVCSSHLFFINLLPVRIPVSVFYLLQ